MAQLTARPRADHWSALECIPHYFQVTIDHNLLDRRSQDGDQPAIALNQACRYIDEAVNDDKIKIKFVTTGIMIADAETYM